MMKNRDRMVSLNKIYIFDRYYNAIFLKNLILFITLFLMIYYFSIMLTNLPSLLRKMSYNEFVTVPNIFRYYFYLFPQFINVTLPFSFLFAMSYSLSSFYSANKALTLVSGGVPVWRISIGSIITAVVLSLGLLILNNTIFPSLYTKSVYFAQRLDVNNNSSYVPNIYAKDKNGYSYFGNIFFIQDQRIENFLVLKQGEKCTKEDRFLPFKEIEKLDIKKQYQLIKKRENMSVNSCFIFNFMLKGASLSFDQEKGVWIAYNSAQYHFDPKNRTIQKVAFFEKQEMKDFVIDPFVFTATNKDFNTMNFKEGLAYIHKVKYNTVSINDLWVELIDSKILGPMLIIILSLIMVTTGKFYSRKYLLLSSLFISFVITFGSIFIINIGYSLAKNSTLPLFVGVPLGYVIILALSFIAFKKMLT